MNYPVASNTRCVFKSGGVRKNEGVGCRFIYISGPQGHLLHKTVQTFTMLLFIAIVVIDQ